MLKTLPDRELRAGLAEVVKYGPIADWPFFEWIEQHAAALLARDVDALAHAAAFVRDQGGYTSRATSARATSAPS